MDNWMNNMVTAPIQAQRSLRRDEKRILTSGNAGKIIPLAVIPLLREDAVRSGRLTVMAEMAETAETLMNGVNITVQAHVVPFLAFERFTGMDHLNRAYKKQPEADGVTVTPFLETVVAGAVGSNEILKTLGVHQRQGQTVTTTYVEAYNTLVNFLRKQRSVSLTQRLLTDSTLAECFWHHTSMKHIVPDFDQARIDGEVALNVVNSDLRVKGIEYLGNDTPDDNNVTGHETGGVSATYASAVAPNSDSNNDRLRVEMAQTAGQWAPAIYAELADNGITVSLSNIDLAKKTAAFARIREQYQGVDDDHIVDLLMSGIRVPDEALKQPILLASRQSLFGFQKRFATDAGNLDKSATNGLTRVDLNVRVPPVNTGGVIIVTAQITPEQLFERQKDYFHCGVDQAAWPEYVRDYLDPEKVDVVKNEHVDLDHSAPDATFGYAPLNHMWQRIGPNIGGKFFRPQADAAWDEDRQRIWAVESVDPTLTEDFYLCNQMHQNVFSDTNSDAFEFLVRGEFQIEGNTVFGAALREAGDEYETVMAQAPVERIEK